MKKTLPILIVFILIFFVQTVSAQDYQATVQYLQSQIELLSLRKEQIDKLIILAENMLKNGGKEMDFEAFDTKKYKEYAEEARKTWGDTTAFKEYEERSKGRTDDDNMKLADKMMKNNEVITK